MTAYRACGSAPTLVFRTSVVRYSVAEDTPSGSLSKVGVDVVLTCSAGTLVGATLAVRHGDLSTAAETVGLASCLRVLLSLYRTVFAWLTRIWLKRTMCSHNFGVVMVVGWA